MGNLPLQSTSQRQGRHQGLRRMLHTQLVGLVYAPDLLGASGRPGSQSSSPHLCQLPKCKSQRRGCHESGHQVESQTQEGYNQKSAENKDNSASSSNRICSFLTFLSDSNMFISLNKHFMGCFGCWLGMVSTLWGFCLAWSPLYFSFEGQNLLAKAVISVSQ